MAKQPWYKIYNTDDLISPSLLLYPDRIKKNIEKMITIVGDPNRLRPHIKTHKTAEIIQMQMAYGIQKFKCATIAEAELLATCGVADILIAMQPVGTNIKRLFRLINSFPDSKFSTIIDNPQTLKEIAAFAKSDNSTMALYIDLNTGMNRTGILPGQDARELYKNISSTVHIEAMGFHVYDGHIRNIDPEDRKIACDEALEPVIQLKQTLEKEGIKVKNIVIGGSPSFPIHAKRAGVEVSPGTTLLWDERYASWFKDMDFLPAAVLFTRIISKPKDNLFCLDLGHKVVASEMDFPRVRFLGMEDCEQIGQSEEHLVVRSRNSNAHKVGDCLYAIPMHVCPTVAKYPQVMIVEKGVVTDSWKIAARDHQLTI